MTTPIVALHSASTSPPGNASANSKMDDCEKKKWTTVNYKTPEQKKKKHAAQSTGEKKKSKTPIAREIPNTQGNSNQTKESGQPLA